MNKILFQQLFTPILLLGMSLTLAFVHRYEEPYPAIYQPAFQRASPQLDQLYTQVATVTARTADGESLAIDYEDIFPFAPDNRDAFLFRMLPDTVPERETNRGTRKSRAKTLKNFIITRYQTQMQGKKANEYEAMLRYLEQRAEERTGQDIVALEFGLYGVNYRISTDRTDRFLEATKKIYFSAP